MLTPQEVSEHAFDKSGFGARGYSMAMVDEFLDQLTEDYTTLYKENAILKSKMKVLAEKVEEYRSTEDAMRKTLLTAQRMADEMVSEARETQSSLVDQAKEEAQKHMLRLREEVEVEQARLAAAQTATATYVGKLKELHQNEMDYLNSLANYAPPASERTVPVAAAVQDIEASMQEIVEEDLGDTKDLGAAEIVDKVEEEISGGLYDDLLAGSAQGTVPPVPEDATRRMTIDLEHLQFGKDYEIK